MASDEGVKVDAENSELKHLGFVRMITMNALVCVSNLYEYAKQNSGPLKSTVGTVENAVTTVVGPVYEKFKGVPADALAFLDKKVDEATKKFDEHAPPLAKKVVNQAQSMVQKGLQVAQNLVGEAQAHGPRAAIHYANTLYKQLVLSQMAKTWYGINQCPPFHAVAQMAVPTATHWSERYNKLIVDMAAKGHTIFSYFPLVPIDEMAKAYKQVEGAAVKEGDATTGSEREIEKE